MGCIVPAPAARTQKGLAAWPVARTGGQVHNPFSMDGVQIVFVAVVATRFILPLFIPRYPLPAIIGCLVVDAADQSIFQAFGYDPPGYQSYDKAMDVFYLAIAYLATLRNWRGLPAYRVGQFLYFYRLVGVVAFELTGGPHAAAHLPEHLRVLLHRLRGDPHPLGADGLRLRWWVVTAGLIWVFVKLPQEYWIHVAQLDVTDFLAEHSWATPLLIVRSSPDWRSSGSPSCPACGLRTTPGSSPPTRSPSRWTPPPRCPPGAPPTAASGRSRRSRRWSCSGCCP